MFDRNEVVPGTVGTTAEPAAVSGVHKDSGDRQRRRGQIQLAGGQADAAARQWTLGARRLHAVEVERQRQRHPHAQRRSAVPAEQQMLRVRVGPVDLRRAAPRRVVDPLRAAVRRGQAVRPNRCRRRDPRRLAGQHHHERVERLPAKFGSGFGPRQHWQRPASRTSCPARIPTTDRRRSTSGSTPLPSRSSRLGTYGNAPRNNVIGPGIFNFDMSIIRNFRLGGSKSLQFRLEAFNVFNQPVWNDPNMSMANLADVRNRSPARESRCASCSSV